MRNRIKELREALGMTQTELGEKFGVHWQTIQRLESGKTKLDTDWIERLAGPLQVDPLEILESRPPLRTVEVLGTIQAGHWTEAWETPREHRDTVAIPDDKTYRQIGLYAARTRGPSMDRRYPEGTLIVFTDYAQRPEPLKVGSRYVVERERADGQREATVKTLWRDDEGNLWLLPESSDPRYQEPIPIKGAEGESIRVVWRVVYAVLTE